MKNESKAPHLIRWLQGRKGKQVEKLIRDFDLEFNDGFTIINSHNLKQIKKTKNYENKFKKISRSRRVGF